MVIPVSLNDTKGAVSSAPNLKCHAGFLVLTNRKRYKISTQSKSSSQDKTGDLQERQLWMTLRTTTADRES